MEDIAATAPAAHIILLTHKRTHTHTHIHTCVRSLCDIAHIVFVCVCIIWHQSEHSYCLLTCIHNTKQEENDGLHQRHIWSAACHGLSLCPCSPATFLISPRPVFAILHLSTRCPRTFPPFPIIWLPHPSSNLSSAALQLPSLSHTAPHLHLIPSSVTHHFQYFLVSSS